MVKGIKFDIKNKITKCFIAGTLVTTLSGLVCKENIRPGDMVLSADTKSFITEYKKALETYVRHTSLLIHLKIYSEEIVTTEGHPFYVRDRISVNNISKVFSLNGRQVQIESKLSIKSL